MKNKIYNLAELVSITDSLKNTGNTIVWTNGCFDIIHYGHIKYLQKAKEFGNILIIGLNTDDSVKLIKGNDRPIFSLQYRSEVVAALESVDFVTSFSEETPYNAINLIKPNYVVKGGDYESGEVVGKDIVEEPVGGAERFCDGVTEAGSCQLERSCDDR